MDDEFVSIWVKGDIVHFRVGQDFDSLVAGEGAIGLRESEVPLSEFASQSSFSVESGGDGSGEVDQ